MDSKEFEDQQLAYCKEHADTCESVALDSKLGFAIETQGRLPINGLRHAPQEDTNGWYIWCGEQLSAEQDFFTPLHTSHLVERYPGVARLLGLPPGYRFLVAGDYIDVWYDATLLDV